MDLLFSDVRLFDGVRFHDAPVDVAVSDGVIAREPGPGAEVVRGGVLFPGFVDAHVHLSFSTPEAVARGGVTTVLDLGAPMPYATAPHAPLRYRFAGPLLTAPGGYPTGSWGAAGYGLEVAHIDDARAAVTRLHDAGAAIIKVALESSEGPELDADLVRCIVEEAHAHGLRVAAHALAASSVATAAECGVDVLAHTPTQELPAEVVRSCAGMIVISTVRAFAGSPTTVRNLTRLVEAGCTAVYGTDLGNGAIRPGIDTAELEILASVLAEPDAALAAATSAAGGLAGCGGRITDGAPADLVWVPAFERLGDLAGEPAVWVGGHRVLA